jgi:phenylalanyl-tRNA synthetase beta chain
MRRRHACRVPGHRRYDVRARRTSSRRSPGATATTRSRTSCGRSAGRRADAPALRARGPAARRCSSGAASWRRAPPPSRPESDGDVALLLPLAATESRLRAALLPGLLRRVEYNFARGARSIRLFEIGTDVRRRVPASCPSKRRASPSRSRVCAGRRTGREPDAPFDVWDLKALADGLAALLGCDLGRAAPSTRCSIRPFRSGCWRATMGARAAPGRVARGAVDAPAWATTLGARGRAAPRRAPQHPVPAAAAVPGGRAGPRAARARRPAGRRVAEHPCGRRARCSSTSAPFDVYSGSGVPEGMRSIAFRLRFRAADRTLTDAEVDDVVRRSCNA